MPSECARFERFKDAFNGFSYYHRCKAELLMKIISEKKNLAHYNETNIKGTIIIRTGERNNMMN